MFEAIRKELIPLVTSINSGAIIGGSAGIYLVGHKKNLNIQSDNQIMEEIENGTLNWKELEKTGSSLFEKDLSKYMNFNVKPNDIITVHLVVKSNFYSKCF